MSGLEIMLKSMGVDMGVVKTSAIEIFTLVKGFDARLQKIEAQLQEVTNGKRNAIDG